MNANFEKFMPVQNFWATYLPRRMDTGCEQETQSSAPAFTSVPQEPKPTVLCAVFADVVTVPCLTAAAL